MTARPAFVLAGGLSSRMGRDKAGLAWQGGTLLGNALLLLVRAGFTPAVAGLRIPGACGVPVLLDRFEDSGPLGGIETALRSLASRASGAAVSPAPALFVPVDLPLLSPDLLRVMWERALSTGAWATVPSCEGREQPLCAVYDARLAPGIAEALAGGDRKVMRVFQNLVPAERFDSFRVEALAPLHGWQSPQRWFANLNTPADLVGAERSFAVEALVLHTPESI
jgi:molybdopterin-guanine dinucleotide biosynthesis protein A